MDAPVETPEPSRWPWILWILISIAVLCMARLAAMMTSASMALYAQLEMKYLPLPTEILLKCRLAIWPLALAAAVSGIPFARRGDTEKIQRWALVVLVLLFILGSTLMFALFVPIVQIQTTLSNK
jgi:hypothetical protein